MVPIVEVWSISTYSSVHLHLEWKVTVVPALEFHRPCMTPQQLPVFPPELVPESENLKATTATRLADNPPTTTSLTDSLPKRIRSAEPVHPARHQVRPHHPWFNRITGTGKACLWESSLEHRALLTPKPSARAVDHRRESP